MIIDIHSHVLPGIDDGSQSAEESVAMLKATREQGVEWLACTSHFYPSDNSPSHFIARRQRAIDRLYAVWEDEIPRLLFGAEVYYFDGISRNEDVPLLRLGDTRLLLLEMPFSPWTDRMVEEVFLLQERRDIQVLMAHIERYMQWQKPRVWGELRDAGVMMQCNASFFLGWRTKRKALKMLRNGQIHFIGSDCHNTTSRPQRIGEALRVIGPEGIQMIEHHIRHRLPELWQLMQASGQMEMSR